MSLLQIRGLTKYFGGLAAVNNLDLDVTEGEILGLVGPNGAGKTTVFNLVTGFHHLTRGKVIFKGRDITNLKPNTIAALGLVRTFQSTTVFKNQTVLDNVMMGHYLQRRCTLLASIFGTRSTRREEEKFRQKAKEILEYIELTEVKDVLAGSLPYGYQRTLGVAIALSAKPELMLLDEPVTGMSAEEALAMVSLIRRLRGQGTTILLVEHDMKTVLNVCERIVVLNFGMKIAEGTPENIIHNKDVIEQYLGAEEAE